MICAEIEITTVHEQSDSEVRSNLILDADWIRSCAHAGLFGREVKVAPCYRSSGSGSSRRCTLCARVRISQQSFHFRLQLCRAVALSLLLAASGRRIRI